MKRFFALVLALSMSLSISGCGSTNQKRTAADTNLKRIAINAFDHAYNKETNHIFFDIIDEPAVDHSIVLDTIIMVDNKNNAGADTNGNITNNYVEKSTNSGVNNVENIDKRPASESTKDDDDVKNDSDTATNNMTDSTSTKQEEQDRTEPTETMPPELNPSVNNPVKEEKPVETEPPETIPSDKNNNDGNTTGNDEREEGRENNAPYDGDTAVPPDAVSPSENGATPCVEHEMIFANTTIESKYQLYNYVTDHYKCANCDYSESKVHIASAELSNSELSLIANQIVYYVNSLRAENGLPALWTSSDWSAWANIRAVELDTVYGHNRPSGGSWMTGIGGNFTIGENISVGHASGYEFYIAFCNSSQHRSIMLSEDAVGIAVGLYADADGNTYCAMVIIG
jgi:uncharacterized protein YkwD